MEVRTYLKISIAVALATIALKTGAWWVSASVSLLSDALESLVNLAGAMFALAMVTIAARPPDDDHPYGHHKAEYFSSGFEGVLIFAAALAIVIAAVHRLISPQPLEAVGLGLVLSVVSSVMNGVLAWTMLRKALVSGEAFPPSLRDWLLERGVAGYQAYATAEAGVIAYETAAREGLVVDEGVVVEIVRPGTGDPLPDGEVGELVVTVLNADYPMVRFGTGDLSAVLVGPCPTGRTNTRIKGWMGRADQTAKVRGMFVHPSQVAEVLKRHPELGRARLVVEGEMANDRMTLHAECAAVPEGLQAAVTGSVRDITKLRCEVQLVAAGSLPNDGKVIDDTRRYT